MTSHPVFPTSFWMDRFGTVRSARSVDLRCVGACLQTRVRSSAFRGRRGRPITLFNATTDSLTGLCNVWCADREEKRRGFGKSLIRLNAHVSSQLNSFRNGYTTNKWYELPLFFFWLYSRYLVLIGLVLQQCGNACFHCDYKKKIYL